MTYRLKFLPSAWKEWEKLDNTIQQQLKKKLSERLENPHVPGDQLRGFQSVYKIKLRASGYRLVYEVDDDTVVLLVIVVDKREREAVYRKLRQRLE